MEKTLHIQQMELINKIVDRLNEERVSYDVYGTDKETAFLSGINEGLDKAIEALKEFEV